MRTWKQFPSLLDYDYGMHLHFLWKWEMLSSGLKYRRLKVFLTGLIMHLKNGNNCTCEGLPRLPTTPVQLILPQRKNDIVPLIIPASLMSASLLRLSACRFQILMCNSATENISVY